MGNFNVCFANVKILQITVERNSKHILKIFQFISENIGGGNVKIMGKFGGYFGKMFGTF